MSAYLLTSGRLTPSGSFAGGGGPSCWLTWLSPGEEGSASALAALVYLRDHQLSRPATSDHAARLLATLAAASDPALVAEAEALAAARAGDHPATFAALFGATPRAHARGVAASVSLVHCGSTG